MKKLLVVISIIVSQLATAQQLPQQTQYMFNQYAFNPAYAGSTPYWETVMNSRYQWVGLVDAPRTVTLTAQGPFKNKKMGIGGMVYNDIVGPTRRLGFQTSYSYHLRLTETINLSMALSFGFNQWVIDSDKIYTVDDNDPFFANGLIKTFSPDAKFGLYLYHKNWYFGAASPQLLHNRLRFQDVIKDSESYLEDHFYFNAGYVFELGSNFELEPTALLKFTIPAPVKLDIGLKATYQEMVWLGVGYRTEDAITAMIGYNHDGNVLFGYAYDYTTTNLSGYSNGTHEVFFSVRFGDITGNDVKEDL